MKTQYTTTVSVQGKGATKAAAFSDALSHVQSEVMKGNAHILLRIEPQDVEVVQALVTERKEAFLFFFPAANTQHIQRHTECHGECDAE